MSENLAGAGVKKDIRPLWYGDALPWGIDEPDPLLRPVEIDGCGESHEGSSLNREYHLRT